MDQNGSHYGNENLVLICVDACEHSLLAFNWYRDNFYRNDHTVGLVHIYAPPEIPSFGKHHGNPNEVSDDGEYQKRLQEVMKKSTTITNTFRQLCTQRGIEPRVYTAAKIDSMGHTICKIAKENNAACIVMGQRGLGAIKRTIFGSVSEYVLHHAHVTVLIVPPPKDHKCKK